MLPSNNPFMDDHIVYAIVLTGLPMIAAGHTLGLGRPWKKLPVARDHGFLK